ncbi:MAG: DUF1573 domain-containing protein [Bacteroides sp.]|nr:DUF1573 domain-containing protein [Bacteroides sp.]
MEKRVITSLYTLWAALLTVSAQARFSVDAENYSFGQIEWKQPVTAQYTITNTGDKPLVLTMVEPDCACTVARWTQTPIAPGEKGTLQVSFDAKALGHFHKAVAVYSNASPHLTYLYIDGQVVQEVKDFSRTHPYRIGDICLDKNEIVFPDVQRGERPTFTIGVANLSSLPYEPILMHLPAYIQAESTPAVLQPNEKGTITLTLDTERLTDLGLTQASVYLSRFIGDKVGEVNEIPLSAVLLPDLMHLTDAERLNAPVIKLSLKELDLSQTLAKKSKAKQDIVITNIGRSPLQISKLQVFHPAVGVSLKKSTLRPGESTRLRVTVQKTSIGKQRRHLRLLMITNDPQQPKVEINIKAK